MKPKHRLIAIRVPDDLPETEPLVIVQQATFDQARDALKLAIKAAAYPHGLTPEESKVVRDALAAMEGEPCQPDK